MLSRFVVLEHTPGPGFTRPQSDHTATTTDGFAHFDWMFETNAALRTWATERLPGFDQRLSVKATALPDHRLHYLHHEGDIGLGRGTVKRLIGGTYQLLCGTPHQFIAQCHWSDSDAGRHCARIELVADLNSPTIDTDQPNWIMVLNP